MKKNNFFFFPISLITLMWVIFFLDFLFINVSFNKYGILPRSVNGLIGIIVCPFLHANLFHLVSNTIPLLILLSITTYFFRKTNIEIIVLISLLGGLFVWIFGRPCYHIGASILIFGLASFLVFFGILSKKFISSILSIIICIFYGSTLIIGLIPIFPGVSWEGHLFGTISGLIIANMYSKKVS